ncbi:hypothetical protein FOXG_18380 [Fusarium oxysporum f. sp. lycopersici 4287]|uniref:Uncharacterized protein n=1 Tax=Fusarium oxysporum f. sp. lycopersici (strain 4287 / CBS 123668 / FGSC 9935 / NRRL 34936) TaxID=426428 RepID=A0A0J9UFW3_FUSO4|nr:hypothetical protein FOXG_18380 [Fusarium oxysporum f. sp. lycopersici 4287]KNA98288.1 hypothetical protein FOXG_18380 [Fusarium oxysporum f. sp. lycopersici 4287]
MLLTHSRGSNDMYVLNAVCERWVFVNGLVHYSETFGGYIETRLRNESDFMQQSKTIFVTHQTSVSPFSMWLALRALRSRRLLSSNARYFSSRFLAMACVPVKSSSPSKIWPISSRPLPFVSGRYHHANTHSTPRTAHAKM